MVVTLPGGAVADPAVDQNFRGLRGDTEEISQRLTKVEKEGLPPSGEAGGVVKGPFAALVFATPQATVAELNSESSTRAGADETLTTNLATEKSSRESADTTIKGEVKTEKEAREAADNERVKGPGSATESDIAVYNGATGKVIKDSGKTITAVLLEAEETARALASAAAAGLSVKNPVSYATTAALTATAEAEKTLEGNIPLEVDGKANPPVGTRILVKNQASEKRNGLYEVTKEECWEGEGSWESGEAWEVGSKWLLTRTSDADTEAEVKQGMFVLITLGATNANTTWILTTENPVVIGTTAQTFAAFTAQPIGAAGGDFSGTYPNPSIKEGAIVNADVNSAAAIAYTKLNLAASITGTGDMAAGVRNYGAVEALPTSPTPAKGDICSYKAGTGIYWNLVYTGEATYPWAKIGGPPLFSQYTAAENLTTESETPQTTNAPTQTTPSVKMEADCRWGSQTALSTSPAQARMRLYVAGAEITPTANNFTAVVGLGPLWGGRRLTLASAVEVQARYYRTSGAGAIFVYSPYVEVDPLRVG